MTPPDLQGAGKTGDSFASGDQLQEGLSPAAQSSSTSSRTDWLQTCFFVSFLFHVSLQAGRKRRKKS